MQDDVMIGDRWIETASGLNIDPLNPDPEKICLEDIARALSQICRFSGHSKRFYSVAEHSLHVAWWLDASGEHPPVVRAGLMHDAAEAYLGDLSSPLKKDEAFAEFRNAEDALMGVIEERYRLKFSPVVFEADLVLLWCEADVLMPSRGKTWYFYEKIGKQIIENNQGVIARIRENADMSISEIRRDWLAKARFFGVKEPEATSVSDDRK